MAIILESSFKNLLIFLLYIFLASTALGLKIAVHIFNIMVVISIILLFYKSNRNFKAILHEKILYLAYIFFNIFSFLSIIFAKYGHSYNMRDELIYASIIPLVFIFRQIKFDLKLVILSACIGSCLNFIFALYQLIFLGVTSEATGLMSGLRVLFGDLSVILGVVSVLCFSILDKRSRSKWMGLLVKASLLMSAISSLLSGSRGSWVGFFVFAVMLIISNRRYIFNQKNMLALVMVPICLLCLFIYTHQYDRFYMIYADIHNYHSSHDISSNSLGLRFEVWKEALWIFIHHPILGIGINSWKDFLANSNNIVVNKDIMSLVHTHSDYLRILSLTGLLGFIPFIIMMIMPFIIFKQAETNLKFAVYSFQIMFMVFMLTDCLLASRLFAVLYAFSMTLFLSLKYQK